MEVSKEVRLLGLWSSPFVFRIKLALNLKGVEYEYMEENLTNKSRLLLENNSIYKTVPVLIHGGKPISESLVILEYIDETWKQNPILPQHPYEKAMVRFWAKFAEDKLTEPIRTILLSKGEEQEKAEKQVQESLTILDGELKDKKKYFGGETLGYLDIQLAFISHWLVTIEEVANVKVFDSNKFQYLSNWMEELRQLSVINEIFPPKNELFAYFQKVRQFTLATNAT